MKTFSFLVLSMALCAPTLTQAQTSSIVLDVQEREQGSYRGGQGMSQVAHYPSPQGGLSVANVYGRVTVGGASWEPRGDVPSGTLVLRHDADGAILAAQSLRPNGHELTGSSSEALPDGGVLVFGSSRRDSGTVGSLARLDANGRVLWAWETSFEARRGCDSARGMCSFTDFEAAAVRGRRGWLTAMVFPGELTLPGDVSFRSRRHQRVLIEVDLTTGDALWARPVRGNSSLLLVEDELVLAGTQGSELALRHYGLDGRLRRTQPVAVTGAPEAFIRHGDGFAVVVEQPDDTLVLGLDAQGRERFRHPLAEMGMRNAMAGATRLAVSDSTLFVLAPASLEATSSRGGWQRLVTRVAVRRYNVRGRELGAPVVHRGQWESSSFGLQLQDGVAMFSGVRVENERYSLHIDRPLGLPTYAPMAAVQRVPRAMKAGSSFPCAEGAPLLCGGAER